MYKVKQWGWCALNPLYQKIGIGTKSLKPLSDLHKKIKEIAFEKSCKWKTEAVMSNTAGTPKLQEKLIPTPYANRGPMEGNDAPPRIIPISALNPYQNIWSFVSLVSSGFWKVFRKLLLKMFLMILRRCAVSLRTLFVDSF